MEKIIKMSSENVNVVVRWSFAKFEIEMKNDKYTIKDSFTLAEFDYNRHDFEGAIIDILNDFESDGYIIDSYERKIA